MARWGPQVRPNGQPAGGPATVSAVAAILPEAPSAWPSPSDPMAVARRLLQDRTVTEAGADHWALRHYRGAWREWTGNHWREVPEEEMARWLYAALEHARYDAVGPAGVPLVKPWQPDATKVARVLDAMAKIVLVASDVDTLTWLVGDQVQQGPRLVAFADALLDPLPQPQHRHPPGLRAQHPDPLEPDTTAATRTSQTPLAAAARQALARSAG
jgi:hypothetical protein